VDAQTFELLAHGEASTPARGKSIRTAAASRRRAAPRWHASSRHRVHQQTVVSTPRASHLARNAPSSLFGGPSRGVLQHRETQCGGALSGALRIAAGLQVGEAVKPAM